MTRMRKAASTPPEPPWASIRVFINTGCASAMHTPYSGLAMRSATDMALKKAWGDLRARKLRTALVVFAVAVAVFGVSAIKILGDQFERTTAGKYAGSNPPDLTVETLPLAAAPRDALRGLDNVQRVEARLAGTTRWRPDDDERKENLAIQGVANFQDE